MDVLFPFADYWWFYLAFTGLILGLLTLDLGVFHRKSHVVGARESAIWSAVWISLALAFGAGLYFYALGKFPEATARQVALEYLTGFVIEKALAVDNIFVFVVVFNFFAVPLQYQHRILFFGILGALVFRAGFIALGAALMQYQWVVLAAGAFLIITGAKILFTPDKAPDPGKNPVVRLARRLLPVSSSLHGQHFFAREAGKLVVTPLLLALLFIEASDIIFAIDSVPAIFAVTKEPLLVFTSNIFAILGLRSLYFLLAGVVHRFQYLKYGLGLILIFVGLKMTWLNDVFDGHFPIGWSLGIIAAILGASVAASLLRERTETQQA
jgi:tellurite resistance protein TerC